MPSEFFCHGFHKDLPEGKASGVLRISPTRFDISAGDLCCFIPFEGVQISLGGASDRLVFIRHPAVPEWTVYTCQLEVLKHPVLREVADIKAQLNKARNKRKFNWGILALVSALIIAVPVFLLLRLDLLTEKIAAQIPVEWEYQLGESSMAQYRLSNEFLDQEQMDELLKPLLEPLLNAIHQDPSNRRYEYQFSVVNDPSLNAFALPGGWVVIHSGLILKAGNAEELLGVLAHEAIHVQQQHGLRNVIGTMSVYLLFSALVGDINGLLASLAGAAPLLLNQSYSRQYEREADTLGHALLLKAKIDPSGLVNFFAQLLAKESEMLSKVENEQTQEVIKDAMSFLSTHPATEDRIAYLKSLKGDIVGAKVNLSRAFELLRESVKLSITQDTAEGIAQ